jgi:hypothetical protein
MEVLFWNLPGEPEEIHSKTSVRIIGVPAEVRSGHLQNIIRKVLYIS